MNGAGRATEVAAAGRVVVGTVVGTVVVGTVGTGQSGTVCVIADTEGTVGNLLLLDRQPWCLLSRGCPWLILLWVMLLKGV